MAIGLIGSSLGGRGMPSSACMRSNAAVHSPAPVARVNTSRRSALEVRPSASSETGSRCAKQACPISAIHCPLTDQQDVVGCLCGEATELAGLVVLARPVRRRTVPLSRGRREREGHRAAVGHRRLLLLPRVADCAEAAPRSKREATGDARARPREAKGAWARQKRLSDCCQSTLAVTRVSER